MNLFQRLVAAFRPVEHPQPVYAPLEPQLPVSREPDVVPAPHEAAVKITLAKEDIPKFARTYVTQLDNRARAEITFRYSSYFGRNASYGTLTQPNGKWVLFDVDAVADKILDPALVPLVEDAVRLIKRLDAEFCKSKPSDFRDERGVRWVRADSVLALAG